MSGRGVKNQFSKINFLAISGDSKHSFLPEKTLKIEPPGAGLVLRILKNNAVNSGHLVP
jgi:hypothetical protein